MSLEDFLANVQKADGGLLEAEDRARINLAHDGELHQIFGIALNVGAEVEHHAFAAPGRQKGGDGRPIDTRQGLQHDLGHGHKSAGIARRHHPGGIAIVNRVDGKAHTRPPSVAKRRGGLVLSRDRHLGVADRAHPPELLQPPQQGLNPPLVAEQQEIHLRMPVAGDVGALDHHLRRSVTAHGVQGYRQALVHESLSLRRRRVGQPAPSVSTTSRPS